MLKLIASDDIHCRVKFLLRSGPFFASLFVRQSLELLASFVPFVRLQIPNN